MFLRVVLVFVLCAVINVDNARILGIFHVPSFSHSIVPRTLLKALVERGHQVTMVSPFPLETPVKNYEDIYLDEMIKFKEEGMVKMVMDVENATIFTKMAVTKNIIMKIHEICLNHTAVKNLLNSNKEFDLVLVDWGLSDVMLGIAHHYKSPVIAVSAVGSSFLSNKVTANPAPYAYVPNLLLTGSDKMTFLGRVVNTLSTIGFDLNEHFNHEPAQERMLRQYFPNAPPIKQLLQNVSLVLLNSHLSIESPRPYVPNMIQIAGLHVEKPKELEKSLKSFMDQASEGVLYFSLGSNAKSSDLSTDTLTAIINTFEKLPVKVLWKFESDIDHKLPPNVKTGKWLPQRDILAHPNLKVFVTHGGLLSTIEAVYRGVPMVGIPMFAEQKVNVKNSVDDGYAMMVSPEDLTEETLTDAIMEVLNNPRYSENVKRRSIWFRDHPVKPLDKAIFWVEYVLRHNGAPHLQTSAIKLSWYQYFLLDVVAFLIGILAVVGFVLIKIVKLLIGMVFKSGKVPKGKAKKD